MAKQDKAGSKKYRLRRYGKVSMKLVFSPEENPEKHVIIKITKWGNLKVTGDGQNAQVALTHMIQVLKEHGFAQADLTITHDPSKSMKKLLEPASKK